MSAKKKNIASVIVFGISKVLKNMGQILKAGGAKYCSVVKTTIMYVLFQQRSFIHMIFESKNTKFISLFFFGHRLADLADFKKVNEIYGKCELFNKIH